MSINTKSMDLAGIVDGNGIVSNAGNLGTGDGVFVQLNGTILEFKSLVVGTNIILTPSSTEIEIATTTSPTIASFINASHDHSDIAGGGQLLSTTALSDTDDIAYLNTPNTYNTGNKQAVRHNTGSAGLRIIPNANNPTTQMEGDIWINSINNQMFGRIDGVNVVLNSDIHTINFIIYDGGSVITTGIKGQIVVDFDCEIIEWAIIGLPVGAIVVNVSRSTFAGFPNTISIAGTELPSIIANNDTGENRALTSWSTINIGDTLEFEVNSVTSIERCTVSLKCRRI